MSKGEERAKEGQGSGGEYAASRRIKENRQYQESWTLRGLTIIAIIEAGVIACLTATILLLAPYKQMIPYLVQFEHEAHRVVRIKPIVGDTETFQAKVFLEQGLRRYVEIRNEVIPIESYMHQRWRGPLNYIRLHSAPGVYRTFEEQSEAILENLETTSNMRRVKITGSTELERGVWRVEYQTEDRRARSNAFDEGSRIVRKWVVFIEVTKKFYETRPQWLEILENPLGFVVTRYRAERQPEA